MVTFQLTNEDARFLFGQIEQQLTHVEGELVRTDKRQLQRELAVDLEHLREILSKLRHACP